MGILDMEALLRGEAPSYDREDSQGDRTPRNRHPLYDREDEPATRPGERFIEPTDFVLNQHRTDLWSKVGMTEEGLTRLKTRLYDLRRETGLNSKTMTRIAELLVEERLRDGEVDRDEEAEATAQEQTRQAADERLRERFALKYGGQREAVDLIGRANKFIRAHPQLSRMFDELDLGRDEAFVERLVAAIHSAGWR